MLVFHGVSAHTERVRENAHSDERVSIMEAINRIRPKDLRDRVRDLVYPVVLAPRDLVTATHLLSSLLATDQMISWHNEDTGHGDTGLADIAGMMADILSTRKHLSAASVAARATVHARQGFDALQRASVVYVEPQAVEGSKSAVKRTRNRKGNETSKVTKYGHTTVQGDIRADDVTDCEGNVIVSGRILESALTLIPRHLTMGYDAYAVNAITSAAYVSTGLIPRALGGEQMAFGESGRAVMISDLGGTANTPQTSSLAHASGEARILKRRTGEAASLKPVELVTPLLAPSVDPDKAYYGHVLKPRPVTDTVERSTRKARRTLANDQPIPTTEAGFQTWADSLNREERVTFQAPDGTITMTRGKSGQWSFTLPATLAERAACKRTTGGVKTSTAVARKIHLALAS